MAAPDPRGVLDTSTFIWLDRIPDAEEVLPEEVLIAAITFAELGVGPLVTEDLEERAARQRHVQQAEYVPRLPFDDNCARAFASVAAGLRTSDGKRRARAFDALIAATAIANDLPLYTGNPSDFDGIPGLKLRVVPAPAGR